MCEVISGGARNVNHKVTYSRKLVRSGEAIDIGLRNITLATKDYGRGKPRFAIYLPVDRSDIWELLWEKGLKLG
jgi:hypothetical protein